MTSASELANAGYPLVMKVPDLCRLLGCHENTLYARIKAGNVPPWERGTGRRARYEWYRPHVETWLANRRGARALRRSA